MLGRTARHPARRSINRKNGESGSVAAPYPMRHEIGKLLSRSYPVNPTRKEAPNPDTSSSKTPALQRYLVPLYPVNPLVPYANLTLAKTPQS